MQTLRIVITWSHLRALHDALRETFLQVTNNEMQTAKPALGAHWFQIAVTCVKSELWVGWKQKQKTPREGVKGGGVNRNSRNSVYSHIYTKP